jgi:hypothetical protein
MALVVVGAVAMLFFTVAGTSIKSGLERTTPTDGTVTRVAFDEWEQGRVGLERCAGDTVFRGYYQTAGDSGYALISVDALGDSMMLMMSMKNLSGTTEHFRLLGPYSQRPTTGRWKWFNQHEIEFYHANDSFLGGDDICSASGANNVTGLDSAWVFDEDNAVVSRLTWTYDKAGAVDDTIDVRRTVLAPRGAAYFLVRYEVRHTNTDNTDSLRFTFREEGVKVADDSHSNDLAWVPNFGKVQLRKDFLMEDIGYCVAFMNTGNAEDAADSSFLHPDLRLDAGSGIVEFVAGFIVWNSSREIVPMDVAITDLANASLPSLAADSIFLHAGDYSEPVDDGLRVYFRTPFITLTHDWQTFEYAIGRAKLVGDQMPPVFQEVVFSNGFVWKCPYTRKQ